MDLTKDRFLAIAPVNGLGNRMRAICSYKVLADYLKVPLLIYWHKTEGFDDTPIEKLVKTDKLNATFIKESEWQRCRENSKHIDKLVAGVYEKDIASADTSVEDSTAHIENVNNIMSGSFKSYSVMTSNSFCIPFFGNSSGSEYTKYKYDFWKAYLNEIKSLEPSDEVLAACGQTLSEFDADTIGIHIRRGDATSRDNPNCYHYGIHPKYIDLEVGKLIKKNSKLKVFLATDSVDTHQKLKAKYKDKIISYDKSFVESKFNSEKPGQFDAMVEVYLLSKTTKLYTTRWSTFSELARGMGKLPSEVISVSPGSTTSLRNLPKHTGVSLLTCCMNRNENLKKSLETWLKVPEIDEIIIVDWGSSVPVWKLIPKETNGKKIKLVSAPDETKWILSRAFNLGASFATRQNLLKLDADIMLSPDVIKDNKLTDHNFFHGTWKTAKDLNEESLNGQLYCKTADFWKVNGYHEGIVTYGWDDDDLYGRLIGAGLTEEYMTSEHIYHIPTSHKKRIESQDEFKGKDASLEIIRESIQTNRKWCLENPWGPSKRLINYDVQKIDEYVYVCFPKR